MNIFTTITLTTTEEVILVELFSNPVAQKYLRALALEDTKELLAFSALGKTDQEIAKALANVQGKLSVISTLLSITKGESQ